ncbi:hypothetical protein MNBD_GAMMA22-450 [hydrothermal vent metagenome]|uniref:DUF2007 domain-containing protein n=1 Tax=hydrothermal vent metagenome TaxID=652676 RepID=A0A3B1AQU6_9ZZZZ
MIRVHSAQDIQQANLILHYLEQHDIKAIILNQYTQGALGELPFTHAYPEIWVEDTVNDKAMKLIASYEKLPISNETLVCDNCQEINPDNFETCWSCAAILKN